MGAFPVISWDAHVWLLADAPVMFLQNNGPRPFISIIRRGHWLNVAGFLNLPLMHFRWLIVTQCLFSRDSHDLVYLYTSHNPTTFIRLEFKPKELTYVSKAKQYLPLGTLKLIGALMTV